MREIQLQIFDYKLVREKYIIDRPAGSIISAFSDIRKAGYWVELICDLMAPYKRKFTIDGLLRTNRCTQKQIDTIIGVWTKQLFNEWLEISKKQELKKRKDELKKLFEMIKKTSGWVDTLGKNKNETAYLCDTVMWSEVEKKNSFIIVNDDLSDIELEDLHINYDENIENKKIFRPMGFIDWKNNLGISENSKVDIINPEKITEPRFDKVIKKSKNILKKNVEIA